MRNCKMCRNTNGCWFTGEDHEAGECKDYVPTTNADRIRSMTDEELTDLFITIMQGYCAKPTSECFGECESCWLDWLRKE